jgi:hypothetical protein
MSVLLTEERPSQERLSDYLNDLALNPRKLASYRRDPDEALTSSELSSTERDLVLSGDQNKLYGAINGTDGGAIAPAVVAVVIIVVVHNPACK